MWKKKSSYKQFSGEQNEQWTKREHGSTLAMNMNPSSSQSLNQDFVKSTTSKVFIFLLSCTLGQRLKSNVLDDWVAHI